jgi:wyosine [tRNA(Phe)-imidazoG37] synthetase (radical SAM superfamily)
MAGYSNDLYTRSYNAGAVRTALTKRYGDRYLSYRAEWARSERFELLPFPINLVFDLINVCNLKCPMCLRSEDLIKDYPELKLSKEKLTVADVTAALDEAHAHGLPSVNIGGSGECTLHPDFLDVCRAVMDRDVMELRIISNGLRLTRAMSEALIDMQAHILSISIDAFSPAVYGKVRGKPDQYEGLVSNVMEFLAVRRRRGSSFPLLRVSFVPQPDNKHETTAFVEHWSAIADMVDVQVYQAFGASHFSHDFECSEPFRRLNVWASKKVGPCCGFPGIVYDVGTLGAQSLAEIWTGEPITKIRNDLLARTYDLPCLRCQGTRTAFDQ